MSEDMARPVAIDLNDRFTDEQDRVYAKHMHEDLEYLAYGASMFLGGVAIQEEVSEDEGQKLLVNYGALGSSALYNLKTNEVEWNMETPLINPDETYSIYDQPRLYDETILDFISE